ncbi:MAG: hypothetical protein K2X55_22555 [Burkholderiaceae bacterium]|nr:hypothetical protein [Burkholderiaceae bacterium]
MKQLFALLATTTLIAMTPAVAQERVADPLGGLARCFDDGDFRVASSTRLPTTKQFREVQTRAGAARVSTVDGYRLMLHKNSTAPLVNLKVEKSADGQFEQDRAAVLAYMELFSDTRGEGAKPLEVTRQDGVEVMALNQPGIDGGGPLSFYSFTHQASGVIGTAYILSQPASLREFHNYAEYTSLRDRFVGKLVHCMAQQTLPPRG